MLAQIGVNIELLLLYFKIKLVYNIFSLILINANLINASLCNAKLCLKFVANANVIAFINKVRRGTSLLLKLLFQQFQSM